MKDLKGSSWDGMKKDIGRLFEEDLESEAQSGLTQIKEKQYDTRLKEKNVETIIYVAIAFYKKEIKTRYKVG